MSWIITDRATGRAVMETFKADTAARVNLDRYRVQEAGQYLAQLNAGYKTELTPIGKQFVIPGTERQPVAGKPAQLSLF